MYTNMNRIEKYPITTRYGIYRVTLAYKDDNLITKVYVERSGILAKFLKWKKVHEYDTKLYPNSTLSYKDYIKHAIKRYEEKVVPIVRLKALEQQLNEWDGEIV